LRDPRGLRDLRDPRGLRDLRDLEETTKCLGGRGGAWGPDGFDAWNER
jgi:hypothetical protein